MKQEIWRFDELGRLRIAGAAWLGFAASLQSSSLLGVPVGGISLKPRFITHQCTKRDIALEIKKQLKRYGIAVEIRKAKR